MSEHDDPVIPLIRAAGEVPDAPAPDTARARAMSAIRFGRRRIPRALLALAAAFLLSLPGGALIAANRDAPDPSTERLPAPPSTEHDDRSTTAQDDDAVERDAHDRQDDRDEDDEQSDDRNDDRSGPSGDEDDEADGSGSVGGSGDGSGGDDESDSDDEDDPEGKTEDPIDPGDDEEEDAEED